MSTIPEIISILREASDPEQLAVSHDELLTLADAYEALEKELAELEERLQQAHQMNANLAAELASLRAELDGERNHLEALFHECGVDLPDEGLSIKALIEHLLSRYHRRQQEELATLRAEVQTQGDKISNLERQLVTQRVERKNLLSHVERLEQDNLDLIGKLEADSG